MMSQQYTEALGKLAEKMLRELDPNWYAGCFHSAVETATVASAMALVTIAAELKALNQYLARKPSP